LRRPPTTCWCARTAEVPATIPFAAIIRPAECSDRLLFFSRDGLVVEARGERCYMATTLDGTRDFANSALLDLSPFELLDASTQGDPTDLDEICKDVARSARETEDLVRARSASPPETSSSPASTLSNEWIRAAARRIASRAARTSIRGDAAARREVSAAVASG